MSLLLFLNIFQTFSRFLNHEFEQVYVCWEYMTWILIDKDYWLENSSEFVQFLLKMHNLAKINLVRKWALNINSKGLAIPSTSCSSFVFGQVYSGIRVIATAFFLVKAVYHKKYISNFQYSTSLSKQKVLVIIECAVCVLLFFISLSLLLLLRFLFISMPWC